MLLSWILQPSIEPVTKSSSPHIANTVTLDTLWHALYLQPKKMSIVVGLHVRNGQVQQILSALYLVFVDHECAAAAAAAIEACAVSYACTHGWILAPNWAVVHRSWTLRIDWKRVAQNDEAKDSWTTMKVLHVVSEITSLGLEALEALEALETDPPVTLGQDSAAGQVVLANNATETMNPSIRFKFLLCPNKASYTTIPMSILLTEMHSRPWWAACCTWRWL
jgi:hypothetical protein